MSPEEARLLRNENLLLNKRHSQLLDMLGQQMTNNAVDNRIDAVKAKREAQAARDALAEERSSELYDLE